jgi:hypothetical protein
MANRPTSYEVGLYQGADLIRVLGFTERHTRGALISFARQNSEELLDLMSGFEAEQEWRYTAAHGLVFGGGVAVRFTQRTRWTAALIAAWITIAQALLAVWSLAGLLDRPPTVPDAHWRRLTYILNGGDPDQ